MSERLIVEFYDSADAPKPLVTVLAYYGGEEPEAAAYTIAAFLDQIRSLEDARLNELGILAARFIYWLGYECRRSEAACDFDGVEIIHDSSRYQHYLIAQVYSSPSGPQVKFVNDSLNTSEEYATAAAIANGT